VDQFGSESLFSSEKMFNVVGLHHSSKL